MVIVDYKKIDFVFGIMVDFDVFRKVIKKMESMLNIYWF